MRVRGWEVPEDADRLSGL